MDLLKMPLPHFLAAEKRCHTPCAEIGGCSVRMCEPANLGVVKSILTDPFTQSLCFEGKKYYDISNSQQTNSWKIELPLYADTFVNLSPYAHSNKTEELTDAKGEPDALIVDEFSHGFIFPDRKSIA